MNFTWRAVRESDFPLLGEWLSQPHVKRWWYQGSDPVSVAADFGPAARGDEPHEDLIVSLDGTPIGLMQRSFYRDFPDEDEIA